MTLCGIQLGVHLGLACPPAGALTVVLVVIAAAAGLAVWTTWRGAGKLRRRLHELQAQDEALSRRCDELTARLESYEARSRLDHLRDLVRAGTDGGRLDAEAGERLLAYLDELDTDPSP